MRLSSRQVWCYWEPAGTLPPYLALCLETMRRNAGVPVTLLSNENIVDLAPGVDLALAKHALHPAQRADYYRSHLLAAQGGIWLDMDSVVLQDLNWIFDGVEEVGFGARRNRLGLGVTPLGASAGAPELHRWIQGQEQILADAIGSHANLAWPALGSQSLTQAVGDGDFFELPSPLVAPLSWQESEQFLSLYTRPDRVLRSNPSIVNLYNERFPPWLKIATRSQILDSRMLLSRLIRVALGQSDPQDERYRLDYVGHSLESATRVLRRHLSHSWNRTRLVRTVPP